MPIEKSDTNSKAMGGSELQALWLQKHVPSEVLEPFQIMLSRQTTPDPSKYRILWCHDTDNDPMYDHLKDRGWEKFHKLVFVSHWQQQRFLDRFQIPWSKTTVIANAIEPLQITKSEPTDQIDIIYHTTPHRGLAILVPVFEKLVETHNNIHLNVFSSFEIYGWPERDKEFEPLFERIRQHSDMTLHSTVDNDAVRQYVEKSHIFAYPSIWTETSSISLMEAMSGGCVCVHPNLGALPETAANWTMMYNYHEDHNKHASMFYGMLGMTIDSLRSTSKFVDEKNPLYTKLNGQKSYADIFYSWDLRKHQWMALLQGMKHEPLELKASAGFFQYRS